MDTPSPRRPWRPVTRRTEVLPVRGVHGKAPSRGKNWGKRDPMGAHSAYGRQANQPRAKRRPQPMRGQSPGHGQGRNNRFACALFSARAPMGKQNSPVLPCGGFKARRQNPRHLEGRPVGRPPHPQRSYAGTLKGTRDETPAGITARTRKAWPARRSPADKPTPAATTAPRTNHIAAAGLG